MATNISKNKGEKNHNSSLKNSYVGKKVYVGIDVHKRNYSVVAVVEGMVVKKWRTLASPDKLAQQLVRYFPGASIETAYEAGFSGFVLHRILEKAGINNIVVNPGSIEVAVHNRVKTDKTDAVKIATLLEAGRLKRIRVPTPQQEQQRLLTVHFLLTFANKLDNKKKNSCFD